MIILFLLIVAIVFYLVWKFTGLNSPSENIDVSQKYDSEAGHFVISGKKNKFIVTKDEKIEFLVEDGQIVACRDKRVSDDFKYYGEN